jgi:tRNA (guanine26-N2/guanine27-N2)-dimethyltransferase
LTEELRLAEVREGGTRLIVPAEHESNGPASADMPVFYNPQMEFNRDMSVVVLGTLLREGQSFLDGLAASGARGIRVAKEAGVALKLHLNDGNPLSVDLMGKNLALNGIADAQVTGENLRTLLLTARFDCVDIDPFGTPAPFFPMAVGAVRNNGILCVTATDTGTISGIFRSACLRKYGARGRRFPFHHEFGVRNLIGFIAREAARQDVGIRPLIAYYADHYMRAYVRIERGASKADKSLGQMGYCVFDEGTLERRYAKDEEVAFGPIWIGQTCDRELLGSLIIRPHLKSADRIAELISMLKEEGEVNRPHFTVDELSRSYGIDNPKIEALIERLKEHGASGRTHYGPKTFFTEATVEEIVRAMK